MARYYQIDKEELNEIFSLLDEITDEHFEDIDSVLIDRIIELRERVSEHVKNENENTEAPNNTLSEIDAIQNLLGGDNGSRNDSGDTGSD